MSHHHLKILVGNNAVNSENTSHQALIMHTKTEVQHSH
uniref:Uncharacterized protein n=1 Tax=Rhizophora mucronata TaxID=61149 RepID=A0A2P2NS44_RHIMU